MTHTATFYPIISAVKTAQDYLESSPWLPINNKQEIYLKSYQTHQGDLSKIPEIESKVSEVAAEINEFLKSKGFDIHLEDFQDPKDFGVASVLSIALEWLEPFDTHEIKVEDKTYPGVFAKNFTIYNCPTSRDPLSVRLTKDVEGKLRFWEGHLSPDFVPGNGYSLSSSWGNVGEVIQQTIKFHTRYEEAEKAFSTIMNLKIKNGFEIEPINKGSKETWNNPILELKTKTSDKVYLTLADCERKEFDLLQKIQTIRNLVRKADCEYESAHIPMVDLNQEVDISWLKYLNTTSSTTEQFQITQALQQTKFKMNELGAKVESAVAFGIECCAARMEMKRFKLDKPFFVWVEREGLNLPIFAGYITQEDWK